MFLSRFLLARQLKITDAKMDQMLETLYQEEYTAQGPAYTKKFTGPHSPYFVAYHKDTLVQRAPKPIRKDALKMDVNQDAVIEVETTEVDEVEVETTPVKRTLTAARAELIETFGSQPGVAFADWMTAIEESDDEDAVRLVAELKAAKYANQLRHLRKAYAAIYGPAAPKVIVAELEAVEADFEDAIFEADEVEEGEAESDDEEEEDEIDEEDDDEVR